MKDGQSKQTLRCAIYTRVSTDQGLEQDFNSLDAQREASEAYIKSQAHEGWTLLRAHYDDGGYSGGSMERPALQKLLADIQAHRINVIVVYKVDRLTRSLADFAKLVELLDSHKVSFVFVTQSFNTTTSMGRLTLNVLLSFAQFEREVTGERIRDKIAASKKKGMWMGGVVPLGYRVEDRALHIVEEHAEVVRGLFRRYHEVGSVGRLKPIFDAEDLRLPIRIDGARRTSGGGLISRGHIYKILSNPIYIGQIAHKGQVHNGQHSPIIDQELWNQVRQRLGDQASATKARRSNQSSDALLAGKLFDDRGNRMTPSWARKGPKRWRYYVSQAALQGDKGKAGSITRVSATEIESRVIEAVAKVSPQGELASVTHADSKADGRLPSDAEGQGGDLGQRDKVRALVDRVMIGRTRIEIRLSEEACGEGNGNILTVPWTPQSPNRKREIIQGAGGAPGRSRFMSQDAHASLVEAFGRAHRWLDALLYNPHETTEHIAQRECKTERSIRMTLSLAFLAPDIVKVSVDGKLPRTFGLKRLTDLPMGWAEQWKALGFAAPRICLTKLATLTDR